MGGTAILHHHVDTRESGGSAGPEISVVVPIYAEEEAIRPFLLRLEPQLDKIGDYEVIFAVDPSADRTEQIIEEAIRRNRRIRMLVFSRRFGQPAATMAGISRSRGRACVVIDVDLQDPPELIADLYKKLREGFDVVTAKRRSRKGETWIKRIVSSLGYRLINRIADVHIPPDTGDFRIMSRRVVDELRRLNERHGFLRGLVGFVGFRQTYIEYDRIERLYGQGNYNRYLGSLTIGWNGVVGFSTLLLSISFVMGLAISGVSFLTIIWVAVTKFVIERPYPMGVPTIISLVLFMGGVQLISVGILGQYVGRIYEEVRQRPQYIIDRIVNAEPQAVEGSDRCFRNS